MQITINLITLLLMLIASVATYAQKQCSDITVIFCGMPERVEPYVMEEFSDILRMRETGEIGPNISFAGLLKFGESSCGISWQKELAPYGYDGTMYIDLGKKNGHDIRPIAGDTVQASISYLKEFSARKYADKDFQFFNTDSLAHLIKTVADAHPAKTYILCLFGHGNGQYCLRDDYYPNRRGVTAEELEAAIKKSNVRLHTIFFHNCLMGTLENLAVYQHCADYALLSPHETCGGYLPQYLANISKAGNDSKKIIEMTKATVDFYAKTNDKDDEIDTSLGYYDLSKVDSLLHTVKDIASWYRDAVTTDSVLIDYVVTLCVTVEHDDTLIQDTGKKSNIDVISKLILSQLVRNTIDIGNAMPTVLDIQTLESLYKKYISQLKDLSYIKCNHAAADIVDKGYLIASPSVSVFSMSDNTQCDYENTMFDRITGWSGFLRKLRVNPSFHDINSKDNKNE